MVADVVIRGSEIWTLGKSAGTAIIEVKAEMNWGWPNGVAEAAAGELEGRLGASAAVADVLRL